MTRIHLNIACLLAFGLLPMAAFAQAPAAAAKKPALPVNKKQPIEITSNSLEVYQEENRAVFVGDVIAIQGDTRLKSDKMTVFYAKPADKDASGEKKPKPPKAPGGTNAPKQDSIRHIDVVGHVVMSRPEDTATGDIGDYDVPTHEIHLHNNVTLTHANNTLKGEHLTYNLDTGKSVLVGDPESRASADKPGNSLPGGRVRALFIPDDKNAKKPDTTNDTKTDTATDTKAP